MLAELRQTLRADGLTASPIKTRAFYLKSYGLSPDVVFDIGVYAGTRWLYKSFPAASWVLIDPQAEYEERLRASDQIGAFTFHAVALGAAPGEVTLNVPQTAKGDAGAMASILERTDILAKSFVDVQTRTVPVKTLDDIAAKYPGRVGIKIDTEGYETQILQGAVETLKRADFVILEMSLDPARFSETPKPSTAMIPLAEAGLELRDILAIADDAGKRSKPRHIDALFTRWAA
ncbi:MAG: FkbM family methyltransferase [Pseudomonadota bacterium]